MCTCVRGSESLDKGAYTSSLRQRLSIFILQTWLVLLQVAKAIIVFFKLTEVAGVDEIIQDQTLNSI
jgi:hypothetical protein